MLSSGEKIHSVQNWIKRGFQPHKNGDVSKCKNMLICRAMDEGIACSFLPNGEKESGASIHFLKTRNDLEAIIKNSRKKHVKVAILPKKYYMLKWLHLPETSPEETKRMIDLELEAILPPEYGVAEVSYTKACNRDTGGVIYEVYVAKQQGLAEYIHKLEEIGITPDIILPTAFLWRMMLKKETDIHLLLANSQSESLAEAAMLTKEDRLYVRSFTIGQSDENGNGSHDLLDCLRMASSKSHNSVDMKVGWVGQEPGQSSVIQGYTWENLNPRCFNDLQGNSQGEHEPTIPVARCVLGGVERSTLQVANMVPRERASLGENKKVSREILRGALCVISSLVLFLLALQVAVYRYAKLDRELASQISEIRSLGEAAGRRIEQLGVIQEAEKTRNDLFMIVEGLLDASPLDVSYNQVDLREGGEIQLRGQAASVSLPFLLPERLERQAAFRNAQLESAGQKSKGAGSIAEFRIDCKLARE